MSNETKNNCCADGRHVSIQQAYKKEPGEDKRKPVSFTTPIQAVYDGKTGASLEAILAQFNSIYVQYQGTPEATRNIIPKEMRRAGLTITYMDMESNTITERASSAVQKDNDHWGLDVNWSRIDELSLSGDISVSANGTWIINGEDTGVKALGPKGDTGITPWLKTIDNKLHFSYDNVIWEPCSENIAAWFRFSASSSDSQAGTIGRIQISRDNKTWTDLSPEFRNYLRVQGYVATTSALPKNQAVGTIYGVGPTYATDDTAHTNPIYRLHVWNGTSWVDNGQFTSIAAGVVQETGDSETEVMSQKAVTEKLSELGQMAVILSSSNTFLDSIAKETISGGMSNKILLANGTESTFSGFNISPYIEVVNSKDYYVRLQGVSANYASLVLYDKNKETLRIFKGGEIYSGVWCRLSLPFAVKYIRISYSNIDNYVYSRAHVESLEDVKELAIVASINKFNKDDVDVQTGKYINSSGAVADNAECFVTGFIPIKNGQTFRINSTFGTGARIQLYDAYKAPISNENYPTTNEQVTGTSESRYVRFTARLTDFDNVMIVEGNMPSVYVPFSNSSIFDGYDVYRNQLIEQIDLPLSSSLTPIETTFTEGTFQDSTQGFYVSDYIKITQENKTYYYKSSVKLNASYKKVIFYDKDYNEIAFINGQGFTTNTVVKLRFPRGTEYIRYCTIYMKHELFQAEVLDFEQSVKGMIDGKFNETNFTDLVKLWGEVNAYETGDGYVNVQTGELVFGDFEYHRKYVVPAGTRSRVVLNNGAGIYAAALVDENNTIIDSFLYANEKSGKEFNAQEKETYLYVSTYKLVRVDYQTIDLESLNQRVEDLENVISSSTIDNNKVLWIGTSIPEGATYPRIACERNGYSCTNKSLGSSMLRFTGIHPNTVQYWSGRCLTATVEELEALYRDDVTNGTITESRLNEWKNYSYERSIVPYIDGTNETQVAMIVIDHGFNDRTDIRDSVANEGSIDWSSRDRSNFVGAFNYLIDRIFEINPFIKIVVSGYFQNKYAPYYSEQICRMQQLVAEHYGFALMDAWNYTQINDLFVPNTANYIADFNAKYGTSYDKLAQDDSGNILSLQLYCPDHVHPHSDKTGNCDKRLDAVYTKLLRSSL